MTENKPETCVAPTCINSPDIAELIDSRDMSHTDKDATVIWVCDNHANTDNSHIEL